MKKIVTHINPDLDAIVGVWLIKKFLPGWQQAEIEFVAANLTEEQKKKVGLEPDTLWIDVGGGLLDHHQTDQYSCASQLCWQYILDQRKGQPLNHWEQLAIEELVTIETEIDNARDLNWPEVNEGRYYFYLHLLIDGLRGMGESDRQVMEFGFRAIESMALNLKARAEALREIENGKIFTSSWRKAIGFISGNKQVSWLSEARGFALAVKKDPETGAVRIVARPDSKVDLTLVYNKIRELDPESDWFLHSSRKLLLNQSSVNLKMRPTRLSLEEIIDILKKGK